MVLASHRSEIAVEWPHWKAKLRQNIKHKLRKPTPCASLVAELSPVDQKLGHTLALDFAQLDGRLEVDQTQRPNRRFFCSTAVTSLKTFGDYCSFQLVDPLRGWNSCWIHSRGDLVLAVTPALLQVRTGASLNWSPSVCRDLIVTFHRLVLNTHGSLLFPAGFQWSDDATVACTRFAKLAVSELQRQGATLTEAQIAFLEL